MPKKRRFYFLIFFLLTLATYHIHVYPEGEETPIGESIGQAMEENTLEPQTEEAPKKEYNSFRDYFDFEGFVSIVSDYRWRGVSQTSLQPAVQGQGFVRTRYGFYGSVWGSYVNFPDSRGKAVNAELDFIVGINNTIKTVAYDAGFLYNYYPGAKGENYGETFFNVEYKFFAAGMAYSPNVFDLNKSGYYVFGDLTPELPITLPFCKKGVTLLLHVGHYTFGGSFNRSSYFDFRVGFAKTFAKNITLDLSFISTDGEFLIDQRDGGPTFVANLTVTF